MKKIKDLIEIKPGMRIDTKTVHERIKESAYFSKNKQNKKWWEFWK